jgi:capsular polysaccharide transport system permease protein
METEDTDLEIDAGPTGETKPGTALARVRAVSLALSEAARRSRLSSRRAARLSSGGFEDRRGAKLARYLLIGSFIAIFVVPTLGAILYFGLIAANQYVAEAEFTVSAGESPMRDGIASLTGIPSQLILQDTQIITNFIHSREMVDKLEESVGIRRLYSTDKADYFARFDPERPVERLVKYWKRVSRASVKLPGGLVKFSVRAFSPQDAKLMADTTLALCEDLVNNLNARINSDALSLAEVGLQRASERLAKILAAEEVERNQSGILETKMSADAISALLKQLRGSLLNMSGAYDAELKYMNADTPQMQEQKSRIDVLRGQIVKLEGQLTTSPGVASDPDYATGDVTVAAAMTRFGALDVERKADEELYTNAASALEHARIAAEFKMIYLKVYVRPSLPEESEYPERGLDIFLVAVSSLTLWGILVALGAVVRNNMA